MPQPKVPQSDSNDKNEVSVNIAGIFVGIILFFALIWSLYHSEMEFAYLNSVLLAALAIGNHIVNMMYK